MKKILFVTAMTLGACYLHAQSHSDRSAPHTEFGLKAGLNVANLHIQNGTTPDARASIHAGGLAHIHITRHFAVQPEIMYSGQGAKQTISDVTYKTRLGYINIPVLAQFMIGDGFRLETGPQLGILAAAHQYSNGTSKDIKSGYTNPDFSWAFGLGYLTTSGLGVDARYNVGINNINNASSPNINNRVFQVGLFYQFKGM